MTTPAERLHVVAGESADGRREAEALAKRLPCATVGTRPDPAARLQLHLELATPHPRVSEFEVGIHRCAAPPDAAAMDRALGLDACLVATAIAAERLAAAGARCVRHVDEATGEGERVWSDAVAATFDTLLEAAPAASSAPPLRVFLSVDASEREHRGGPSVRMRQTAEALERLGHTVTMGERPEPDRNDVVHVFNTWPGDSSLARMHAARDSGAAVVLSPIYMDHRENFWARRVLRDGLAGARRGPASLGALLRLRRTRPARRVRMNADLRAYHEQLPRMFALADHVVLLSHAELLGLRALGCEPTSRSFVWNAVDARPFANADPERFRREHGLGDYVLCVGRVEFRKNQALLLRALRGSGLGVVLVGGCLSGRYRRIVEALEGPGTVRVDHLEAGGGMLASAYAGAAAFALPSWVEGAPISALEAAAAGTPLVLGDRAGVREYFGCLARYCEPGDPDSIRRGVEAAIAEDAAALRARRRRLLAEKLTPETAARETDAAYRRALRAREEPAGR